MVSGINNIDNYNLQLRHLLNLVMDDPVAFNPYDVAPFPELSHEEWFYTLFSIPRPQDYCPPELPPFMDRANAHLSCFNRCLDDLVAVTFDIDILINNLRHIEKLVFNKRPDTDDFCRAL